MDDGRRALGAGSLELRHLSEQRCTEDRSRVVAVLGERGALGAPPGIDPCGQQPEDCSGGTVAQGSWRRRRAGWLGSFEVLDPAAVQSHVDVDLGDPRVVVHKLGYGAVSFGQRGVREVVS